mmetsp:Transcript_895/g.2594  ORF Transcript_895/g.2594 Transcript_895/m.2594 type:complete len:273 (-) Transcript_895:391-1209(-)
MPATPQQGDDLGGHSRWDRRAQALRGHCGRQLVPTVSHLQDGVRERVVTRAVAVRGHARQQLVYRDAQCVHVRRWRCRARLQQYLRRHILECAQHLRLLEPTAGRAGDRRPGKFFLDGILILGEPKIPQDSSAVGQEDVPRLDVPVHDGARPFVEVGQREGHLRAASQHVRNGRSPTPVMDSLPRAGVKELKYGQVIGRQHARPQQRHDIGMLKGRRGQHGDLSPKPHEINGLSDRRLLHRHLPVSPLCPEDAGLGALEQRYSVDERLLGDG